MAGVTATDAMGGINASLTTTDTEAWLLPSVSGTVEKTFMDIAYATPANARYAATAQYTTNHCWTAVQALPNATALLRVAIGGYTGSITTCLKHAVDGYSFWGANIMAKIGSTSWAHGTNNFLAAAGATKSAAGFETDI